MKTSLLIVAALVPLSAAVALPAITSASVSNSAPALTAGSSEIAIRLRPKNAPRQNLRRNARRAGSVNPTGAPITIDGPEGGPTPAPKG